jgi:hypothetical protein
MKKLIEIYGQRAKILSESKDDKGRKSLTCLAKWQMSDVPNQNFRIYPKSILEREIKRLSPDMRSGKVLGMLRHPKDEADLGQASHMITEAWIENDGSAMCRMKILSTDAGENLKSLIYDGAWIGLSSRGAGSTVPVKRTINGKEVQCEQVAEDYKLRTVDAVDAASVSDARVIQILEALEEQEIEDVNWVENDNNLRKLYDNARIAGFQGTFVEYLESMGRDEYQERLFERYIQAKEAGFKSDFAEFVRTDNIYEKSLLEEWSRGRKAGLKMNFDEYKKSRPWWK